MPDLHDAELLELAYPYALDSLSDDEQRAVEHALSEADEAVAGTFRATVRDIRETVASMTVVDAVPAPPKVEAALQRALDAQLAEEQPTPLRSRRAQSLRWMAAAAAAVLIAVAIGVGVVAVRSPAPESTVTAQQVRTHSDTRVETADVTGGGTVTVHASTDLDAAIVSFTAVAAAPVRHTYQLWRIPPDGSGPRSAAVLDALPTESEPLLMRLEDAQQLALSIEPAGGSPQPTTDPIVAVPIP